MYKRQGGGGGGGAPPANRSTGTVKSTSTTRVSQPFDPAPVPFTSLITEPAVLDALAQRGFTDVSTLSGGSTTFRFWHDVAAEDLVAPAPMENYAETESLPTPRRSATGVRIDLDCTGLACPGPSVANPGSATWPRVSSPTLSDFMFSVRLRIGPGQARPVQSRAMRTPGADRWGGASDSPSA